jgi:hypothetical protein
MGLGRASPSRRFMKFSNQGQTGYKRPLFSVVIVTYKRSEYLARALQALQNQKNTPLFETLIIDNEPKKLPLGSFRRAM